MEKKAKVADLNNFEPKINGEEKIEEEEEKR